MSYGYVIYDKIFLHCCQNKTVYCKMGSEREKTQNTESLADSSHVRNFSHPKKKNIYSLLISSTTLSQVPKLQEVTACEL